MKGPRYKFPRKDSCKISDRAVWCTAERVLSLYNQANKKIAKRLSKSVKNWFISEAEKTGWAGCHFLPDVQSGNGAGCILFIPPQQLNISINVTKRILVLEAENTQ